MSVRLRHRRFASRCCGCVSFRFRSQGGSAAERGCGRREGGEAAASESRRVARLARDRRTVASVSAPLAGHVRARLARGAVPAATERAAAAGAGVSAAPPSRARARVARSETTAPLAGPGRVAAWPGGCDASWA